MLRLSKTVACIRRAFRCVLPAALLMGALFAPGLALGATADPEKDLRTLDKLEIFQPGEPSILYSAKDEAFAYLAPEYRIFVPLARIPKIVRDAFLAAEDAEFYSHGAISLKGMARAALRNLTSAKLREGGSTITQQLAKTLFLTSERTVTRKLKEIQLAREIEQLYSKDKILEMYLNAIYLGGGAYGVEAASRVYFGRSVSQLSLAEAAVLAGLPKAPNLYSPLQNPAKAKERRDYVLSRMQKERFISPSQAQAAQRQRVIVSPMFKDRGLAGAFVDYVRDQLEQRLGRTALVKGGLRIYTTLDLGMQREANQALQEGLADIEKRQMPKQKAAPSAAPPPLEGALVSLDPVSGEIRAMVGGRDYAKSQFNRAVQARRQPGSAFKPFIYAAALEQGFTLASLLEDFPVSYSIPQNGKMVDWSPENYDRQFRGEVTLRRALEESINVPTVRLLDAVGVEKAVALAHQMGIVSDLRHELALALGVSEVNLLEMTSAYAVMANDGVRVPPRAIRRVVFPNGTVEEESSSVGERVLPEEVAFLMTSLLEGAAQRGTARRASVSGRIVAAKTGTTQDAADLWLVGYVPRLATGLWVGYDVPRSLGSRESAGMLAAPVWSSYMQKALEEVPLEDQPIPEGIFIAHVNSRTGLPTGPDDPEGMTEYFRRGEYAAPGAPVQEEPALAIQPEQPIEPSQTAQPTQPSQPGLPAQEIQPAEPTVPIQPVQPIQPRQTAQPSQPAQPMQPVQPPQPSQPTEAETPFSSLPPQPILTLPKGASQR
jgi:1A family penicillin-binding protein